jgi:glycosyltransferase involved in cell wall biosynthesis
MADWVIVHGERIRKECELLMPWLRGRVVAIPHGPLGEITDHIAGNWERGALLFFGRIEQYKGLRYFIDAVKVLNAHGVSVKGIIAGTGHDLEQYRSGIEADGAFELIDRYIGDDEIPSLFGRANVVVLPYTDATQSGVVAMALRYGRPVVATDVGSIGEVVRDGYNGLLVPPRDVSALTNAIQQLVQNQGLAASMARNATQLATTELSWETIADSTVEAYRLAMAHKSNGKGGLATAGREQA